MNSIVEKWLKRSRFAFYALLLMLISYLAFTFMANDSGDLITGFVTVTYKDLEGKPPTFTNIRTTVYHTTHFDDFGEWHSGAGERYDTSTHLGWCVIPISQRGFYEDIRCQGSGIYNNQLYQYNTVGLTPADSTVVQGFQRGRTSTGKDPTPGPPMGTVAVNPVKGTPCHIPYGTVMYIYFEEGNPWNGLYVAEDTGSAMRGQCRIDVYAGVGLEASRAAEPWVSNKYPEIYLLGEDGSYDHERVAVQRGVAPMSGVYSASYGHEYIVSGADTLFEASFRFAEEAVAQCSSSPYNAKENCVASTAAQFEDSLDLVVNSSCLEPGFPEYSIDFFLHGDFDSDFSLFRIGGVVEEVLPEGQVPSGIHVTSQDSRFVSIADFSSQRNIWVKLREGASAIVDEEADILKTGMFLEVSPGLLRMESPRFVEVEQARQVSLNPAYFRRELLKQFVLELADCKYGVIPEPSEEELTDILLGFGGEDFDLSAVDGLDLSFDNFESIVGLLFPGLDFAIEDIEPSGCLCNIRLPELYNSIVFYDGSVMFSGIDLGGSVNISFDVFLQNESDREGISKSGVVDFSHRSDKGVITLKKDLDGDLIAVYDSGREPGLKECIPEDKHFLFCAHLEHSPEDIFRFALKI